MIRIFAISLGCPKNRVDTEHSLGFSRQIKLVTDPEKADWIFLNTCGFIAPAVEESVQTIMEYIAIKTAQPLDKQPKLIVAGCLVGRYGKETLAAELPEVDLFLDARQVSGWELELAALAQADGMKLLPAEELPQVFGDVSSTVPHPRRAGKVLAHTAGGGAGGSGVLNSPATAQSSTNGDFSAQPALQRVPRLLSTPPSYAWLKISEGCRHSCAFCTIPSIRGELVSTPLDILLEDAAYVVSQGVKELILVAQDVTAWGRDGQGKLQDLLEKLLPMKGIERLRLMYMYPAGLDDDLLSFLQQAGKPFVPYFDVPLQHAAPNVLRRMGRPFAGNPRETIDRIRRYFPEAALRTTLITGFPGETEKDFEELVSFVDEVRFHHLGVFAYYAEEGTRAAAMPDQVPERVRDYRRDCIMENQEGISEEIMRQYLGTVQDILVDAPHEEWPGLHTGRAWFQAPDIDGQVYVSGRDVTPGVMVKAEITDTDVYDMSALSVQGA